MLQQVLFLGNHLSLDIWSLTFDLANGFWSKAGIQLGQAYYDIYN